MLTSKDAEKIAAAAERHARANNWAVTIAIVDDGGHLLHLLRLDGAAPSTAAIAPEKARLSALTRRESLAFEDMINKGRVAFLSAPLTGMLEGAVPIIVNGDGIGAVGVSGAKSDQDAAIARAGNAALD